MGNISAKINLRQLQSAVRTMKGKSGDIKCLVIPIAANNLVEGEKGVYLDLIFSSLKRKLATARIRTSLNKAYQKR